MAYERMLLHMSNVLKSSIDTLEDSKLVTNFKLYYQSCLNQSDVELNADADLFKLLEAELGRWPLVPRVNASLKKEDNYQGARFSNSSLFGVEEHLFRFCFIFIFWIKSKS